MYNIETGGSGRKIIYILYLSRASGCQQQWSFIVGRQYFSSRSRQRYCSRKIWRFHRNRNNFRVLALYQYLSSSEWDRYRKKVKGIRIRMQPHVYGLLFTTLVDPQINKQNMDHLFCPIEMFFRFVVSVYIFFFSYFRYINFGLGYEDIQHTRCEYLSCWKINVDFWTKKKEKIHLYWVFISFQHMV